MRCKALLLDLDGVLADTEPLHTQAWNSVLSDIGATREALFGHMPVGTPAQEVARYVADVLAPGTSADVVLERKRLAYRALIPSVLKAFPGLADELALWTEVPVVVTTSGARAEAHLMLDLIGLSRFFRFVVAYEDVPRPKPAPDGYLRAAAMLGMRPGDCAAVEDSPRGLQAAISAGTVALAVPPASDAPLPSGAAAGFPSTVAALRWLRG
jgi:HAD superfamily hydrolase (TIGR01509 family)